MKYIDINAMIGHHFCPWMGEFPSPDGITAEMDRFGIDQACVYHGLARDYDIMTGNTRLIAETAREPRLLPAWVAGSHYSGSIPRADELVRAATDVGVRLFRLFVGSQLSDCTVMDTLFYGELLAALERDRIATVISFDDSSNLSSADIAQVDTVLESYPKLPVVLSAPKIAEPLKLLFPRFERHPQFAIDISGLHGGGVLENTTRRFGAGHLIFGSHFPWFTQGQVRISLEYADISDADREAVAHGNAERLLSGEGS